MPCWCPTPGPRVDPPTRDGIRLSVRVVEREAKASDPLAPTEENPYYWRDDPVVTAGQSHATGGPTVIELFCGLGGMSQGFIQAGFQLMLGADIHRPSICSYQTNHPDAATVLGDLRKVSGKELTGALDGCRPDVLVAGVPCQGFSTTNRKRHPGDARNQLFLEFMRLAEAVQPRAIVIENVSALRVTARGGFESAITAEIESRLKLRAHVVTLNAADFGVPQHRQRVFFVGVEPAARWSPPSPTHGPVTARPHVTVRDAIHDLPALAAGESSTAYTRRTLSLYAARLRGAQKYLFNHQAPHHPPTTIARIAQTPPGEPMYPQFRQRIRLDWDRVSPTQVSGGIRAQFQFGHPDQARGLTIRERCRLQSFPDAIEVCGGLVQGRIQTGNAVPPLLAEAVARTLLPIIDPGMV